MSKTTVIFHSADYDGVFCREIARKFLPDAELIGWDFGDKPLPIPEGQIYILDLPVDRVFGMEIMHDLIHPEKPILVEKRKVVLGDGDSPVFDTSRIIWIDHHKSSIESHPNYIPGYRIDGVAACRLAWQWFTHDIANNVMNDPAYLPTDVQFKNREVSEPLAVRLAGEYDVWDHRGDGDLEFQFGLDTRPQPHWLLLLAANGEGDDYVKRLICDGGKAMACYAKRDAAVIRSRSFLVEWEGLKFLALNTARCNSNTFAARDIPDTGHDALMGFYYNGSVWTVSLYHAQHRKDLDLSLIASKHGGGGHRGACGMSFKVLPFISP